MAAVDTEQISFTAFGVPMEVAVPAWLRTRAPALTPPGATPGLTGVGDACRATIDTQLSRLRIAVNGITIGATEDEDLALRMLGAQIRAQIALLAPDHIFVRAGVVAVRGRAVVIPGLTFAGKTTLTRALVEAGAMYYSDEFAVLDGEGLVHPFPAAPLDAETDNEPVPVALVAITSYRPGARLFPKPLATGPAIPALLGHTIAARTRPQQAISALRAALNHATAWVGERGEAVEAVATIMDSLA